MGQKSFLDTETKRSFKKNGFLISIEQLGSFKRIGREQWLAQLYPGNYNKWINNFQN